MQEAKEREERLAKADLENFSKMASSNHTLATDDAPCRLSYCSGPERACGEMVRRRGCVVEDRAVPGVRQMRLPDRPFHRGVRRRPVYDVETL